MSLRLVLGVARSEARQCRRLVRYWVFAALALIIGLILVGQYTGLHWYWSSQSATAAMINPRYLVPLYGGFYLAIFLLGLLFLGLDVRGRDARDRIAEALDARPFSNLQLLTGRWLGLLAAAWLPAALAALLFGVIGWLAGSPIQPLSLLAFTTFMAVPGFAFFLALTFLVTLLMRHRGLAALVLLAILGAGLAGVMRLPIPWATALDLTGAYALNLPSDIVPAIAAPAGWAQRAVLLLAAAGMLVVAAAVHPRRDDRPRALAATVGLALLAASGAALVAVVRTSERPLRSVDRWRAAHEARRTDPEPDVRAIRGRITLEPGRELVAELELDLRAPEGATLREALVSLNPGFGDVSARAPGGAPLATTFRDGLLAIALPRPLSGDAEQTIAVSYRGRPDPWFGYLDAAKHPLRLEPRDAQMLMLGYETVVFDARHVALPAGGLWLPRAGSAVGRDDTRTRPRDVHALDLIVDVPAGWLVAGPGRRRDETGATAGRARFRFTPPAPLYDPALVAGRFTARSAEVEGVTLELLVHPAHAKNLDVLDDAGPEVRSWIAARLEAAAALGLAYPYDGLSLVEVPNPLRGWGGGWRLDTTLAAPGLVMMRESGFPTARFDAAFRNPDAFRDREGGVARAMRDRLIRFFENDVSGGNPFSGAARSFLPFQTSATGPDAPALDYVVEELTSEIVTERRGYFSAHVFGRDLNQVIFSALGRFRPSDPVSGGSFSEAVIRAMTGRAAVWDAALGTALDAMDPWADPRRAIDVLTLKAGGLAQALLDERGSETTGKLLAALRARCSGRAFTRDDLVAAAGDDGPDLATRLRDTLGTTALPGFSVTKVATQRYADGKDGAPRYQFLLGLQNDETVPGLFALSVAVRNRANEGKTNTREGPFRVPPQGAVEVGVVTAAPVESVIVVPYLALNREPFGVPVSAADEENRAPGEPFAGVREVPPRPRDPDEIVVDDLDPGFETREQGRAGWLRLAGRPPDGERDGGYPVVTSTWHAPAWWSRLTVEQAWGRYRHTLVMVAKGTGARAAAFRARLPRPGAWTLDVHVPSRGPASPFQRKLGKWTYTVAGGSLRQEVELNGDAAEEGWNSLGVFELDGVDTTVELTDRTDGAQVLADAIRWRPVR